jgi:diguanylate cyclase (GGDEF)-like protein
MTGIVAALPAPAVLHGVIVVASLACSVACALAALRSGAAARASELALREARADGVAFAGTARRLAGAARESVHAVREEIARAVRTLAPAVDGVLLYEEYDCELICVAAFGARFAYFAGARAALDDPSSLPARAFATGHHVRHSDIRGGTMRARATTALAVGAGDSPSLPVHPGDAVSLAVPLALERGRRCVLVAASQRAIDDAVVERLVALADHASPAYMIALDRENDRRNAEYDGLTGLLTPRAFRQRLAALVERARFAPSTRLALVFADTDRFKCWNDCYGHAAGDALLRELARVLRSAASPERDLVARNGGDEFCIVFADLDKAAAIERAEALRQRIATIDFAALHSAAVQGDITISASIGVAALPADAATASDLLERADAAMYHSKQTGRNGVSYLDADGSFTRVPSAARVPVEPP